MSALLALAMIQAVVPPACDGGLCDADRIAPFLRKLAHASRADRPVRILQIGDSHTAGDQITGTWRTILQSRYGSGGRGVLPPGRPYQGYLTRGITAYQSKGWTVDGIFGPAWRGSSGAPVGLSGYSLSAATPGATLSLAADPGEAFNRLTVCARASNAGTLRLAVSSTVVTWSPGDDGTGASCRSVEVDATTTTAFLSLTGGAVTVTSWETVRRHAGGVVLSNLGTVGAQLVHFGRTDDAIVARELAEYAPDLIVVAFGTNEAFRPGFTAAWYESMLRAGILRLQRLAPGVPMLLLGAPDSATRIDSLKTGEDGISPPCRTAAPAHAGPEASWTPTAALATVQAIQGASAHDLDLAFWDWSKRMGGRCIADDWVRRTPALMRGDHVHFTTPGAAIVAGMLQQDIDAAIARLAASSDDVAR